VDAQTMQNNPPLTINHKQRNLQRIFQEIQGEIRLLTVTAKFNHTTCKTDDTQLKLTLAYIDDPKKLAEVLQNRLNLILEATS